MNFGTIQGPTYVGNVQEMYRNYRGKTGGTTRTALAKFSLLTQWLGTIYDASFCIICTSLERPFQTEPWIFLLYTIATSYVVEKQIVFQFYRIIDLAFLFIGKIQLQKEFCYIYRCVITQEVYRNYLGTPGLGHKIRPIKKPTTFHLTGDYP